MVYRTKIRSIRCGFSLLELLTVILIVGILAAASIPILRGRVDNARWTEAETAAGMIRDVVAVYYSEHGTGPTGSLGDPDLLIKLDLNPGDLTGTYFVATDYVITGVNEFGWATVRVSGSLPTAPQSSRTYYPDGTWE